jgi:copper(I)-binding protein
MHSDRRTTQCKGAQLAAFVGALAIGLTTCSLLAPAPCSADVAATITVSNAWIRWLPSNLPAAGYATLRNVGDQPATLTGASTPDYGAAMFHESRNQRGVEQMMPIDSIEIKPHSQVSFAPQSYHIMLMRPTRNIHPGDSVLLSLHFSNGQSLPVQFEVRKPDGTAVRRAPGTRP